MRRFSLLVCSSLLLGACARPACPDDLAPQAAARNDATPTVAPPTASTLAETGPVSAPELQASTPLPSISPKDAGLDPDRVARLIDDARARGTSQLAILRRGRIVVEENFTGSEKPIETMSVTKSLVSLLVGKAIDEGKLRLDQPVHELYPEWAQGQKGSITVRHLLEHASGLQANRTTEAIYASPDFVQLALCAELSEPPGTRFRYNNKAVNLLAGLVEKAVGHKLDDYARRVLFEPLGIAGWEWMRDESGNPHGMSGLRLHAADLAKIGWMVAQGGSYEGQRILSEDWIRTSTQTAAEVRNGQGLLWWFAAAERNVMLDDATFDGWRADGVPTSFMQRVEPLRNRELSRDDLVRGGLTSDLHRFTCSTENESRSAFALAFEPASKLAH